jgi:choline dehydrogenase-like flavoprotein
MATTEELTDVVVVGSGAGGGTLAWHLAREGVKVTVLEKGPHYDLRDFAQHDELKVQKRHYWAPSTEQEPHMLRRGDEPGFTRAKDGWIANCVGGGTVHMSGFFLRLHPEDLAVRTKVGVPDGSTAEDWPLAYEELSRWYERIEYLLGVGGHAGQNPFDAPRSKPYPLPPIAEHPFTAPFDAAARKLGLHPYSTPRAVLSRYYAGRAPCNHCGYCANYGCEIGAKSSVLAALIPGALASGNCTLVPGAMVTDVTTDASGKATGVRYLDAQGAQHQVRARVVVVSCSSIESARLLLMSKPGGLANGSGLVGQNLHFSAYAGVDADFHRDGGGKSFPGWESTLPFLGRSIQDHYLPTAKDAPGPKAGTLRFDMFPKPPVFRAQQVATRGETTLWGQPLKDALRRHFHGARSLECEYFGEMNPSADTFVQLDPDVKDKWGLPVARIQVRPLAHDVRVSRWAIEQAAALFRAMGADRVGEPEGGGATYVLQHGTCRMGTDPSRSVLDPSCRTHEVPNLYVVDGSFMPSSGGVPTTLTIMANSLRVAHTLRDRLARREH